jgi:lipopolysaccharide export LptBFGC system permease protein LptF
MRRPGDGLRRLAGRVCSERTRRRLIDPAVADLQSEFADARRTGSRWRTLTTLGAGYVSLAKVVAIAAVGDVREHASAWQPEERSAIRRGVGVAAGTITIVTALLIANTLSQFTFTVNVPGLDPDWTALFIRLAWYLIPSTLAMTVPLGLALAVAWTFHGAARTRKLGAAALVAATLASAAMFVNVAWLTPEANQAFRQIAVARFFHWDEDRPLARGDNELTLSALRTRMEQARTFGLPHTPRFYQTLYYQKLSVTVAAVPLVGALLAIAFRQRWGRWRMTTSAIGLSTVYFVALTSSTYINAVFAAPPIVAGWSAAAACALAAGVIALMPRGRGVTSSPSRA